MIKTMLILSVRVLESYPIENKMFLSYSAELSVLKAVINRYFSKIG